MTLWGPFGGERLGVTTVRPEGPSEPVHGRWCWLDVSDGPGLAPLVGSVLQSVHPLRNRFGHITGAELVFPTGVLAFFAECDSDYVFLPPLEPWYERFEIQRGRNSE